MRKRINLRGVALPLTFLVMLTVYPVAGFGDVPQQVNYQGQLTDETGAPVPDGPYQITFSIYDGSSTQQWSETQSNVQITNGIFNVILPANPGVYPFPAGLFDEAVSLGIAVGTDGEMTPRQALTAVAFALKAENSDTLAGQTLDDLNTAYVNIGETNVITSAMVAPNSLISSDLATNSVTFSEIAPGAVGTSEIVDGSVSAADLSDDYVNTSGDSMSGNLAINADLNVNGSSTSSTDFVATFESSGGPYAYAIQGIANSADNAARGLALNVDSANNLAYGAHFDVDSYSTARGIYLDANSSNGYAYGADIRTTTGSSSSGQAIGIRNRTYQYSTGNLYGITSESHHYGTSGAGYAINAHMYGSDSGDATAVYGRANKDTEDTGGTAYGGHFVGDNDRDSGESCGVLGEATGRGGNRYGVFGRAIESGDGRPNFGVYAQAASVDDFIYGLSAEVDLESSNGHSGYGAHVDVRADPDATGNLLGVMSYANHSGPSGAVYGVYTQALSSDSGDVYGVFAAASGAATTGDAYAGYFSGDVHVSGTLSKSAGSFKIDHPLDPENRYLQHSFVESPEMMNVYNGNVLLDETGAAWVELPDYFEALNRDFRYQLTCIGGFAPVFVAEEIAQNSFKIAGGQAGMKVSWQVTGIRQDAWANDHRIKVEVDKRPKEVGAYLYPEGFGLDQMHSVGYARHPANMQGHIQPEQRYRSDIQE